MQNPAKWNLVTNSPYLLVPNPFYKNGSGFNVNHPYPSEANPPAGQPSNLNAARGTILNEDMLGSPIVAENTFMPQNPLENVENHPPVTNSAYLLVPNPFYKNGSGFNVNHPYPSEANPPDGQPSNLNAARGTILKEDMLESPIVAENTFMPQNPLENVENNPPIVEHVGNVGVEEVGNPLIPPMVGAEVENVENPLGSPLPPPMVEGEDVGNFDGNERPPIFKPNDKRLVIEFLAKRLRNEPLEANSIQEINFYDHTPQYISENYIHAQPGILYFFTPVRRHSNLQAVRSVRGEGGGRWSCAGGVVQHVRDTNDDIFDIKTFKFVPKDSNPSDASWLMKEYSLSSEERHPGSSNMHECVLVKLYQK